MAFKRESAIAEPVDRWLLSMGLLTKSELANP